MIHTRLIRELTVDSPSSPQRSRKLSAASGLVLAGDFIYVVVDDENHLGVFPAEGAADGTLVRLFPGDLPQPHKARKASKADPEALTRLPAAGNNRKMPASGCRWRSCSMRSATATRCASRTP